MTADARPCYRGRMWRASLVAACLVAAARPAVAYEYQVRSVTVGQAYQLPTLHLLGAELWLARRRFGESLSLSVWDLGDLRRARLRARPGRADAGPVVWFTGQLRLEHDFGAWTMGSVTVGGRTLDALDAIPELATTSLGLELVHGTLGLDDLWQRVDVRLGRLLHLDDGDPWSVDGVSARVRTPWPVVIEVMGGLRVRDASPLGTPTVELDGTPGADCTEYVEGPSPGTGTWQIIDRSRVPGHSRLGSDLAYCPQREASMPTVGAAVETTAGGVRARLAYRRTMSRTVGLLGAVDRLDEPDRGLYPDELDQAPTWGVNEELVAASVEGRVRLGGWSIAPWARGRYALTEAVLADAGAGARLSRGAHALTPEVGHARPVFDADSIWSTFAIGASTDGRLGYEYAPRRGPLAITADAWYRRYAVPSPGTEVAAAATRSWAAGARAQAALTLGPRLVTELDLVGDDGYGGRRLGATGEARWQARPALALSGRLGGLHVATDQRASTGGASGVLALGSRWGIDQGMALTSAAELSASPRAAAALRVFVALELVLEPER